jgi:hypothetical protein
MSAGTPAAVRPVPSGSFVEVDVHRAGERVGHHQRRRGEVVGAHVRVDAALEVAVARQHRHRDEVVARLIACEIGSGSGPELPMQVVQP